MKKTILLCVLIIGSVSLFAQRHHGNRHHNSGGNHGNTHHNNRSELVIKMWNNSYFSVKIDGVVYHEPTSYFVLSDIRPGKHFVSIVTRHHGHTDVLFKGNIRVPKRSKVIAEVSDHHDVHLEILDLHHHDNYHDNHNDGWNDNSWNDNHHDNHHDGHHDNHHDGHHDNHNNGHNYGPPMLNFVQLSRSMEHTPFDSDKLAIAQQAVTSNGVTADQVARIVSMFTFESSKLKIAKAAYANCVDRNNYYLVNNAFTFSSSIRELNTFILSQN